MMRKNNKVDPIFEVTDDYLKTILPRKNTLITMRWFSFSERPKHTAWDMSKIFDKPVTFSPVFDPWTFLMENLGSMS
jgi:hypothetical protein